MRALLRSAAVISAVAFASQLMTLPASAAEGSDEIGRLLAEEFAKADGRSLPAGVARVVVPADRPSAADEQRILDEIEMLERARAEAETRRDAMVKAREEAERDGSGDPDAARKLEQARRAAEDAQRAAEVAKKAEDDRRLAEERRKSEEAQLAAEAAKKAEADRRVADERRRAEEAQRTAEAAKKAEDAELAQMQAEREAEADRIDDALRRAREARAQRSPIDRSPYVTTDEAPANRRRIEARDVAEAPRHEPSAATPRASGEPSRGPQAPTHVRSTKVAVLLTIVPGHHGIRRHNKTGDPILCGEQGCYVSTGAASAAELMPVRRAFGVNRTLGERAGACSNTLGCVFRNIDLVAYPAILQPVDMRLVRHDRRQPHELREASACSVRAGRLACTAIEGPDYTMWVVPEEIAEAAGPAALERAVEEGLAPRPDTPLLVRN